MLTVCCFLWYDPVGIRNPIYIFDDSHVRRLKEQVEKNLTVPHEFVCVTERKIEGVKTIPMEWATFIPGTRFAKLMLFNPEGRLTGKRILYLDLDSVITNSINPLVEREEDLVLWRNPNFGQPWRARYNTSLILHTVGTRPEIYTLWKREHWIAPTVEQTLYKVREVTGYGGTDQAWVSHITSEKEAFWTDKDGVYGAGRLTKPDGELDGVGTELPDNARIVFTPGQRTPWTRGFADKHPWSREFQ